MLGIAKRIHGLSTILKIPLLFVCLIFCQDLWAAQDAIVIAEKAVVYADKTMTSPVGYVTKGKKVTIGEIARNKSQVYPIIVSGRVAYIRVIDVSTEIDNLDSNRLVAERFTNLTRKKIQNHYTASVFTYPSQVSLNRRINELRDKDAFLWNGFQLLGSTRSTTNLDLGVVFAYAEGKENIEAFRMIELGGDVSYRIFSGDVFTMRWQNQLLGVPLATYSLGTKARVNGYGIAAGSGLNANWVFGNGWGFEVYGGLQYTKLFSFDLPDPRNTTSNIPYPNVQLNPSFVGTRIGLGATYQY